MIFGDHFQAAATVAPANWIEGACEGASSSVGALVPNKYPLFLRVHAPEPGADWWSAYRRLFETTASIGERHTSSPDKAWFAVWEGHGFADRMTQIVWQEPLDDATRSSLEQERSRLRDEAKRSNAAIRAALSQIPRFDLPDRAYYLLAGAVGAATQLSEPGPMAKWRNPDLFWPDDRRWFVATDVDFWSLYVGGDHEFISELARSVSTKSEIVTLDHQLETEV